MDRCVSCGVPLRTSASNVTLCDKCQLDKQIQFSLNAFGTAIVDTRRATCKWNFDRYDHRAAMTLVWKTECGREFDRLRGSEQPRKHLCMEFCCFCGGTIIDETQDC